VQSLSFTGRLHSILMALSTTPGACVTDGGLAMNSSDNGPVYWDPYNPEIWSNPYPVFRRLREETPLYYNAEHDFYALSRFADIKQGLADGESYSSARGGIIEFIKANMEIPQGMFIFEDPPMHTAHRSVVSRVFTPRKMSDLEPKIRAFCQRCLDPLRDADKFDFINDLGAPLAMRVIGMLLGIPEEDQAAIRAQGDAAMRAEAGKPMDVTKRRFTGESFEDYVDWRVTNPSDDLMSELLSAEFDDETGTKRKLTRDEVLMFVNIIAGAGNETTARLIGWTGKLLSDHPDQRRELVKNPARIPNAIEEILRFEPPGHLIARYVTRDVEHHGKTVPAGSTLVFVIGSANRDDRQFPDGDRFDMQRPAVSHITFGGGVHACLGKALARVEGHVALDEVLKRWPDWTVDMENARLSSTTTVRGWDTLPAFTR
jgi:cytochrome P450